jgi:hypothetical protein
VVVADFDIVGITVDESKTDTPLVIDGDGVLALSIVLQRVQVIARWNLEIVKLRRQVHVLQFPDSTSCNISWESLGLSIEEQVTGAAIGERLDHLVMYRVT